MKPALFCILVFFALSCAKAQPINGKDSLGSPITGYHSITIWLEDPEKGQHSSPGAFSHFEILDERADTARIGLRVGQGLVPYNRQMIFAKKAAQQLADYLNGHFSNPEAPNTALIVLRALWIADETHIPAEVAENPDLSNEKVNIRLKAEVYSEKEGLYTPLFRYDSTELSRTGEYAPAGRNLADMLNDLADSAAAELAHKGTGGRKLSMDDIVRFNRSRFDPVISGEKAVLASGVYKDFGEFKDNAPSIQEFETVTEKGHLMLYRKDPGGKTYYCRDVWGYCDGKSLYVMKDGVLIPAWKEGKAYYFLGSTIRVKSSGDGAFSPAGASLHGGAFIPLSRAGPQHKHKEIKHIYVVDMDTGDAM